MLVLSRRTSQSILIGGKIVITVVTVRGKHVRLGIEAPKELSIRRVGGAPIAEAPLRRLMLPATAGSDSTSNASG
jgi:hypothetical protein